MKKNYTTLILYPETFVISGIILCTIFKKNDLIVFLMGLGICLWVLLDPSFKKNWILNCVCICLSILMVLAFYCLNTVFWLIISILDVISVVIIIWTRWRDLGYKGETNDE